MIRDTEEEANTLGCGRGHRVIEIHNKRLINQTMNLFLFFQENYTKNYYNNNSC
jgi:hypothetical protein